MMIASNHFRYAFDYVLPSVSKKDEASHDRLRNRMARARTRGSGGAADLRGGRVAIPEQKATSRPERS